MSSIRRSSLISITSGLLTVIGGYLSFASLEEAAGQCLECPLEPCIRARRYGAGRPVLSLRWRLGPASFGSYDDASIATAQAGCRAPAPVAVTAVTGYSSNTPSFFGQRVTAASSLAHRSKRRVYGPFTSVVQKIALAAIVDQAIIQTRGHPLRGERDGVIRGELLPGPICHEACRKGGEIRDEQGRRI
jgi:hypothetical protein